MSGMTETWTDYESDVEVLQAEIRRLREENEHWRIAVLNNANKRAEVELKKTKLEKELKGIGAEQYYSMRQKYWDEQEHVKLLKQQNAELAEELRKTRDELIGIGFFRLANRLGEALRKYGLEGEADA